MSHSNRSFATACASSATDDHILAVFPNKRPCVLTGKKRTGIRWYICEKVHGGPASPGLIPYPVCGEPDCYNPRHMAWQTPSEVGARRPKKRTLAQPSAPDLSATDDGSSVV